MGTSARRTRLDSHLIAEGVSDRVDTEDIHCGRLWRHRVPSQDLDSRLTGMLFLANLRQAIDIAGERRSGNWPYDYPDTWPDAVYSDLVAFEQKTTGMGTAATQLQHLRDTPKLVFSALCEASPNWLRSKVEHPEVWAFYVGANTAGIAPVADDPFDPLLPEDNSEWDWIVANEDWLNRHYTGLWIGVVGDRIVSVADTEVGVLRIARDLGYSKVFSYHVPKGGEPAIVALS